MGSEEEELSTGRMRWVGVWGEGKGKGGRGEGGVICIQWASEPPEVHTELQGSRGQQVGGADPYRTPQAPACHFSQAEPH